MFTEAICVYRSFRYLDPCPKNNVISFSHKGFCAFRVRVRVRVWVRARVRVRVRVRARIMVRVRVRVRVRARVEVRVSVNMFKHVFGQTSIRASVIDPIL